MTIESISSLLGVEQQLGLVVKSDNVVAIWSPYSHDESTEYNRDLNRLNHWIEMVTEKKRRTDFLAELSSINPELLDLEIELVSEPVSNIVQAEILKLIHESDLIELEEQRIDDDMDDLLNILGK